MARISNQEAREFRLEAQRIESVVKREFKEESSESCRCRSFFYKGQSAGI